jgi:hypothetical protein
LIGLPDFGGGMNDPTGTTTCFGFLGFFASLFPRNWLLAMTILLAATADICDRIYATCADLAQVDDRPMRENR